MGNLIKSAYGLTISESYIFERILDMTNRLCWKPEDMGLSKVHFVDGEKFSSRKAACTVAKSKNCPEASISSFFEWLPECDEIQGIERQKFLANEYWPKREQIANMLFDSVVQSQTKELIPVFQEIFDVSIGSLEFVDLVTTNNIRKYTGQPDTTLIDRNKKQLFLLEIKVYGKTTKYTLDQHIKYIGLNVALRGEDLFPGYLIHNLLLAPEVEFINNTKGLEKLKPVLSRNKEVKFDYSCPEIGHLKPTGSATISELIVQRFSAVSGFESTSIVDDCTNYKLHFRSWHDFIGNLEEGNFKYNLLPLLRYLGGPDPSVS